MKKPTKVTLIFLAIAVIFVAVWYFVKKKRSAAAGGSGNKPGGSGGLIAPVPGGSTTTPDGFPLKKGSRGKYVSALQNELNSRGFNSPDPKLKTDGVLGPKTEAAMIRAKLFLPLSIGDYNKFFKK